MRGMRGRLRQGSDGLNQIFLFKRLGFSDRFPQRQFSNGRATGHSRNATLRLEADLNDSSLPNVHAETEHIPTGRVFHLNRRMATGKLTCMAGVLEVIQKSGRVHRLELYCAPLCLCVSLAGVFYV